MSEAPAIPEIRDQEGFNLDRWDELCADPVLAALDHRIETDRYGHIIMTQPPGFDHGDYQAQIAFLLQPTLGEGKPAIETPISTSEGVRAADVVWISLERLERSKTRNVLTIAPEICVEVLSRPICAAKSRRRNISTSKRERRRVWICDMEGRLFIYLASAPDLPGRSLLCPSCPEQLGE